LSSSASIAFKTAARLLLVRLLVGVREDGDGMVDLDEMGLF
jgi:hypothetical protein